MWFYKHIFLTRVLVIYTIHLLFKGFDRTFGVFLEFTIRGITFSVFFISLWVSAWYLAEWINKRISDYKQIIKLLINILFGFSIALITNSVYCLGDTHLFDNSKVWEDISFVNPEFSISLLLFYLLGYSTYEYIQSQLAYKEKQLRNAELEKENVIAQYKSLKAQIEPHFLFNSLSVLSSIVHTDAHLASEFIVKLSKTLRYIIEKNEFALVTLKEELSVVKDYFYLLKIRFDKGIELVIDVDETLLEKIYISPASIQLLIENAIKHNKLSDKTPLRIDISIVSDYIVIKNNLNIIRKEEESTSVGLQNIRKRYKLLCGKDVVIMNGSGFFIVKLPILNRDDYANFNN